MTALVPTLRAARASDALALAPLVYGSGERAFDWIFAGAEANALPFLVHCLGKRRGLLGWANHHVLELGGEPVASIAVWTWAQILALDAFMVPRILGFHRGRSFGVIARSLKMTSLLESPKRGELYLAHLTVDARHRGCGLGSQLLDFAEAQARARSCRSIVLDVADDNHGARRLYESRGYVAGAHRPFTGEPPDAVPGHDPMRLEL